MSIYCAREFRALDVQTIRDLIAQDPKLQRSALSRKLCQLCGWTKPNGELKDRLCCDSGVGTKIAERLAL